MLVSELVDAPARIVQETDLITATNDAIYALLPETDHKTAVFAAKRIQSGVRKSISDPLDLKLDAFPEEEIGAMLAELQ